MDGYISIVCYWLRKYEMGFSIAEGYQIQPLQKQSIDSGGIHIFIIWAELGACQVSQTVQGASQSRELGLKHARWGEDTVQKPREGLATHSPRIGVTATSLLQRHTLLRSLKYTFLFYFHFCDSFSWFWVQSNLTADRGNTWSFCCCEAKSKLLIEGSYLTKGH